MSAAEPARGTRHAGIERDDVIETARRLVEAEGGDALTMRRLAAELGVTPTTLYWHVGRREDIVAALIERQSERMALRTVEGDTARDRVMHAALHVWETALANPRITGLAHTHGASSLLQLPQEIALARELTAAGVTGPTARDALRSILACVGGFLVAALRRSDGGAQSGTALWHEVDAPGIDAATRAALAAPADLDALVRITLGAVVEHWVPDEPRGADPSR